MKVLPNPPGDGDVDETRLAAHGEAAVRTPPGTPVSQTPADPNRTTGWSTTSGIDHGRFPPGTILGDRYRIVGRLGKGGMGEVFCADDLKLGQQVALKFLPSDVDRDPVRLTQLHTEVRMARQGGGAGMRGLRRPRTPSTGNVCPLDLVDVVDAAHVRVRTELIRRREQAEIVAPSALARDLSPEIDRAIMRCLAPDPQVRPGAFYISRAGEGMFRLLPGPA